MDIVAHQTCVSCQWDGAVLHQSCWRATLFSPTRMSQGEQAIYLWLNHDLQHSAAERRFKPDKVSQRVLGHASGTYTVYRCEPAVSNSFIFGYAVSNRLDLRWARSSFFPNWHQTSMRRAISDQRLRKWNGHGCLCGVKLTWLNLARFAVW